MNFEEWYKTATRGQPWFGLSASCAIKDTAEKAWRMGVIEAMNFCRIPSKIQELVSYLSSAERSELLQSMLADYCVDCGEYLGCDCEGCGCTCV